MNEQEAIRLIVERIDFILGIMKTKLDNDWNERDEKMYG